VRAGPGSKGRLSHSGHPPSHTPVTPCNLSLTLRPWKAPSPRRSIGRLRDLPEPLSRSDRQPRWTLNDSSCRKQLAESSDEKVGSVTPRYKMEPGDVRGHRHKGWKDMQGQEVTVRLDDGTEARGHISRIRFEVMTGSDTKSCARRMRFEKSGPGKDTEGHGPKRIELEVDDAQAKLLRAATDRGISIYIRLTAEDEVQGHPYMVRF
jgi:hypothetical protein